MAGGFNWQMQPCPWCGALHDDGVWIQTENKDETVFVCHECADEYLKDTED